MQHNKQSRNFPGLLLLKSISYFCFHICNTLSKVLISFYVTYVTAHCIANYLFMTELLLYLLKLRLYKSKCISFSLVNYIYLICCCITEYIEVVSEKIHLDAGFFRIHRLHAKLL